MNNIFKDFDFTQFWESSDYANQNYVGEIFTEEQRANVEEDLGYRLPESYIELMKHQNGGLPKCTNHRTNEPTSWSEDHIAITGIYGLDLSLSYSLSGSTGSKFWVDEWEYPEIGIYFADCPSAGHDMLCLDYRECGPQGEPKVVHVDQESNYKITPVAETFEAFIRGLEDDKAFETDDGTESNDANVVSAWVDPNFAKKMGIEVPGDGWIKRKPDDAEITTKKKTLGQKFKEGFFGRKKTSYHPPGSEQV